MSVLIEDAVAVAEVAKVTKAPVAELELEALALNVFIGSDWAGRPAVSVVDAAALVSGSARRTHDHDARWRQHAAAVEAWEQGRLAAHNAAVAKVFSEAGARGMGSGPAVAYQAQKAGTAGALEYERANPAPKFDGAATSSSWFNRAREVVGI